MEKQGCEQSEKSKSQKKEDAGAGKGRKVAKHCFFQCFGAPDGCQVRRLAKAAGAEPSREMRDEKLHGVVARSTFRSQNAKSASLPEYFWKFRCRNSAAGCGAKRIWKSKC